MADFHVQRDAGERYGIDQALLTSRGDLVIADVQAIRRLAARMNERRAAGGPTVTTGQIAALGLLHEIGHLVFAGHERARRGAIDAALEALDERLGPEAARLLDRFAVEFPGQEPGPSPAPTRLEELMLIRVANENPALGLLRELVDDRPLERATRYREAIASLEAALADGWSLAPEGGSLLELLRAPARRAPTSLAGQLRYVREQWGPLLGDAFATLLTRLDTALGILQEEELAMHLRFGGGPGRAEPPVFGGPDGAADEPEAFSSDSDWMPRLVLMAKSTYVWLDQLSRTYARDIRTLDAIPDEELDVLARWGVTGLWLIGLWQRSPASELIKRMRGNPEAVASAYSLDDYRIADDLGGEAAYESLRDRAWRRGIRLSSDMVPNHMGIDSRWVIEHPDWFLSLDQPPFPAYSFTGADLSSDPNVGIVLEDHYWDDSDAAVVFKRFDRHGGPDRYIYHGNDGTSFPWNDTAQLDFLNPVVRERVIQTILAVARRFPVIRFDAAMVLARKHIERLWWPEPGVGGGIPSRAEFGSLPADEFERRMPAEFWREVVDRVAAEVPETLLLAEAFWMLEGYFVRTLGMHRVYNSAFMHMLRDEDGAGYRTVIKDTIEFDPEILKRYVNFMSNPDEKTALEQFGKGDKYFGVAMVMATMPGLPMLGHGQVQGFSEKYGMEFRRATLEELPDHWLVERHEREIFPLLHRRSWFAEAGDFLLYDLVKDDGSVDEHVFAYSNGSGPTRSLVLYHDRFGSTSGRIRESAAFARKSADGSKSMVRRTLADGLGLPDDQQGLVIFRDARNGLESIRSAREIRDQGWRVSLDAYGGHVYWEFRSVRDGISGQWSRLAERLGDRPVPSLEEALRELQLEPVHAPFRALFGDGLMAALLDRDTDAETARLDGLERRLRAFLVALAGATGVDGDPAALAAAVRARVGAAFRGSDLPGSRVDRAALLAWLALSRTGELAPGADAPATSRAWYDELRLPGPLAAGLREVELDEGQAWWVADHVRVLLALPRPSRLRGPVATLDARLIAAWLADDAVRAAIGVNTWEGVEWLDRDRFRSLLAWAERLDGLEAEERAEAKGEAAAPHDGERVSEVVERLLAVAETAGYRVDSLLKLLGSTGTRGDAVL
ncbi:MAG: alpha-amylase [Chloroflexi bacterium]|nr:alpha-amylase [Chloroflexota bacterium]